MFYCFRVYVGKCYIEYVDDEYVYYYDVIFYCVIDFIDNGKWGFKFYRKWEKEFLVIIVVWYCLCCNYWWYVDFSRYIVKCVFSWFYEWYV